MMSDVERLREKFETGELLRPSPEIPNIVDLARALARLAGTNGLEPTAGSLELAALIGAADHLVFVLADGLGMNLIEESPETAFLSAHVVAELRTVFPSATPVALASLATGEWPGRHGVTGWWTHLPEIGAAAALLPFITRTRRQSLTKLGVTVEQAFPLPVLMGAMGRDTLALFPERIADSVSSIYLSGNRARRGYRTLAEAVDLIAARIAWAEEPTYTYLYTDRVDHEAHRHGLGRPEVRGALRELDRELARLAARLDGRGRIVLTADHGLLDTPADARHRIKPSPELFDVLLYPPTGDARVLYLHVREGAEERIRRTFRERYGDRFILLSIAETERFELFGPGPISSPATHRLGDLIAISSGRDVIDYLPSGGMGRVLASVSHHSGLTPAEMRVPLVVV